MIDSRVSILSTIFFAFFLVGCSDTIQEKPIERSFVERMEDKLYPMEGHFIAQNYPEEKFALNAYRSALAEIKKEKTETNSRTGDWVQQGPGNIGGRINSIAVNPSDGQEMMLGYSFGGVFRTTDGGANWSPIFDDEDITSISDVAYDPNNSDKVFVGTGDLNISGYPVTGNGLFRSLDGGDSWDRVGLTEAGVIAEIGISQSNSDIVYAASMGLPFERTNDRGLYKSLDGGDTWEQVFFLNDSTGIIDIEVHPTNPDIVFAASWTRIRNNRESTLQSEETGIYKTVDGGENWIKLTNGLPSGSLIRPGLAIYEGNPNIMYSMFVHNNMDTLCSAGFHLEGVYKTIDAGETWTEVPTLEETGLPCTVLGGFGWYFGQVRVNPENPDQIFILGVDMYQTDNGGVSWEISVPPWFTYDVHADKHDLVFNGNDIILATDGGAYRLPADSSEWEDIENIVATQFYRVAVNNFDNNAYGGAQDNGSTGGTTENINEWPRIFGGDGFQMVFHPTNPDIFYVETQRGSIRMTFNGGASFQSANSGLVGTRNWDMQYIMSVSDPNLLYTGTDRMFRSFEFESTPFWLPISGILTDTVDLSTATSHTISTLDESPVNVEVLYCGTSDGLVWRSLDAGNTWDKINDGLPRRYISDIKASRSDEAVVYVTIQGYRDNDFTPYIYKSTDNGDTWVQINGNLPQIAINDILLPETDDDDSEVYVGTDGGVYYTQDAGVEWIRLGDNLPIFPVYDLAINNDNQLVAGTFARGIYTYDISQLDIVKTDDVDYKEVRVYPTSTTDVFNIESDVDDLKLRLVSPSGIVVRELKSINGSLNVDISELSPGIYFISGNQIKTQKIIKI